MPNSQPLVSPMINPITFPSSSATRPEKGYRELGSSTFFLQKSCLIFPKTLRSISTIASKSPEVRGRMSSFARKSSSIGSLPPILLRLLNHSDNGLCFDLLTRCYTNLLDRSCDRSHDRHLHFHCF